MTLTFKKSEITKLASACLKHKPGPVPYTGESWEKVLGPEHKARFERGLCLVGDDGVYFMSNHDGQRASKKTGRRPIAYAIECNPDTCPDWWEVKQDSFGGDDGVEFIPIVDVMKWIEGSRSSTLAININSKGFLLG
jgi:hypothetical protein